MILFLIFNGHTVPAVIHIDDLPVHRRGKFLHEYGGQHPVVGHADHRIVLQDPLLSAADSLSAHKSINILAQIAEDPPAVFKAKLALLLIQKRIGQLQAGRRIDFHLPAAVNPGPLKNDILFRLLLSFKKDKACRTGRLIGMTHSCSLLSRFVSGYSSASPDPIPSALPVRSAAAW